MEVEKDRKRESFCKFGRKKNVKRKRIKLAAMKSERRARLHLAERKTEREQSASSRLKAGSSSSSSKGKGFNRRLRALCSPVARPTFACTLKLVHTERERQRQRESLCEWIEMSTSVVWAARKSSRLEAAASLSLSHFLPSLSKRKCVCARLCPQLERESKAT